MLPAPRALLFDFGGVLADAPSPPPAPPDLVDRLTEIAGQAVPADQIARDLARGARDYERWRDTLGSGAPEALRRATAAGLPLAVVSNTLCGAAIHDFLTAVGLSGLFTAEFYSDQTGVRKPNPEFARMAARAVGVPIDRCWFVGDSVRRDITCARRAGAGAAVLMRSPRTDREQPVTGCLPDATVEDGHRLVGLLDAALPD